MMQLTLRLKQFNIFPMNTRKTSDQIVRELLYSLGLTRDSQLAEWLGVSAQAVSQAKRKGKIPENWLVQIGRAHV